MSFFSNLLGAKTSKDADLDALFQRTQSAPVAPAAVASTSSAAAIVKPPEAIIAAARSAKSKNQAEPKRKVKKLQKPAATVEQNSDDDEDLEESYIVKKARQHAQTILKAASQNNGKGKAKIQESSVAADETMQDTSSESEDDGKELVHEADIAARKAAKSGGQAAKPKRKVQPEQDASPADKDARTTFLGNVPIACVSNKSVRKALIRHLISTLPSESPNYQALTRNQSIRFRSLPLAAPAPLASGTKQSTKEEEPDSEEESENRSRKRARMWRENEVGEDGDEPTSAGQAKGKPKFLTAAQKRKVAFINKEVSDKATSCNAYVVWTTKDASQATSQQLAGLMVKHANNTIFEGQTLRVDKLRSSGLPAASEADPAVEVQNKKLLAAERKEKLDEDKRTLYLGSLDFEEKEQAVRDLCEKLMQEARGQAPAGQDGSASTWVERVRVVKDQETGQGKGFAYVLFKDQECVDEMLAFDSLRVKLSKRKLRLERCKSSTATAAAKKAQSKIDSKAPSAGKPDKKGKPERGASKPGRPAVSTAILAKPRPDIGESLRDLSREERKTLKSTDEERLQRRLAKKQKTRESIRAVKAKEALDNKIKKVSAPRVGGAAGSGKKGEGKKKTRVRSARLEGKKNSKKPEV